MNKPELIDAVARKADLPKTSAESAINALIEVVTEELAAGGEVPMYGLGKFEVAHRKSRAGRNPKTGEAITIAARKAPVFKASKMLREALNK